MTGDRSLGSLRTSTPALLADKVAWRIMDYASARAVTMDPEGRVWVEPVAEAAECDLVGVYTRSLGVLELSRALRADLAEAKAGLGARQPRRVVVGREATAKRRAA